MAISGRRQATAHAGAAASSFFQALRLLRSLSSFIRLSNNSSSLSWLSSEPTTEDVAAAWMDWGEAKGYALHRVRVRLEQSV